MSAGRALAALVLGAATFALVLIPWPGWRQAHGAFFRASAALALAALPLETELTTSTGPRAQRFDTVLVVSEHGEGAWRYHLSSRDVGLLPLATFLGLFLGSRVFVRWSWGRLAVGLLAVELYVLARVVTVLLHAWTFHSAEGRCPGPHPGFLSGTAWRRTIAVLAELESAPAVYALVPLVIWAVVLTWRPAAPRLKQPSAS